MRRRLFHRNLFYLTCAITILAVVVFITWNHQKKDHVRNYVQRAKNIMQSFQIVDDRMALPVESTPVTYEPKSPKKTATLPLNSLIPSTVHYIWCNEQSFQFQHYISMKSVIQHIDPIKIVFHYDVLPSVDRERYYLWFDDVREETPGFVLRHMSSCSNDTALINTLLGETGGIYVPINAVITREFDDLWNILEPMKNSGDEKTSIVVGMRDGNNIDGRQFLCESDVADDFSGEFPLCMLITKELKPVDIINMPGSLGIFYRNLMYGKTSLTRPSYNVSTASPRHTHLIYIGFWNMTFLSYISILSDLYVADVDTVFIHSTHEPDGLYWKELQNDPRIVRVAIEHPETVYGKEIRRTPYASDVIRIYILLKYGGVYHDIDVLWTKRIPDEYFAYDSVIGYDWVIEENWPDKFNNGCLFGKKNALFLKELLEMYTIYTEKIYGYNSLRCPVKVYERYPDSVFVDRHLQVLCYKKVCHPPWMPNFKSRAANNHNVGYWNWQETLSIHFTSLKPREYRTLDALMKSREIFAEVGKNVIKFALKSHGHPLLRWKGI